MGVLLLRWFGLSLLALVITLDWFWAPYSKVEESFNVQATHDLFYLGFNSTDNDYDHLVYAGVVPRTFAGATILTILTQCIRLAAMPLIDIADHPMMVQAIVRAVLGCFCFAGFRSIARALDQTTQTKLEGTYFLFITATQFHLPFYATRLLPNTLATVMTLFVIRCWILEQTKTAAALLVTAVTIFRCDLLLLLFTCGLSWLITRQLGILSAIGIGILSGLRALALTVPLDSHLWGYTVWPEGQVFYFNTVLGKSTDWGTSPWHWYFTSALPKALLGALPLACLSLTKKRWLPYSLPAFGFVIIYSFLEHKEVRFLFPVIPLFNVCAAFSLANIHRRTSYYKEKRPSTVLRLGYMMFVGGLLASFAVSRMFAMLSYKNYPGGDALLRLTDYVRRQRPHGHTVKVFIDNTSAMTGVSLFGQRHAQTSTPGIQWEFFKEGYEESNQRTSFDDFDFVLTEDVDSFDGFDVVQVAQGHPRLDWREMQISTENAVYVLQRRATPDAQKGHVVGDTIE